MKPKYRVEAFIIPSKSTELSLETSLGNEIDDVKVANKLKELETEPEESAISDNFESKLSCEEDNIYEEPIYDVPYSQPLPVVSLVPKSQEKYLPTKVHKPMALGKLGRSSSLMSIDERGETDEILEEFCFQGYAGPSQRPEDLSEEIFKENWLRRLETLRERESVMRDKESLLQERERLLFKKERELRILERLIRDKLKQADFYLSQSRSLESMEEIANKKEGRVVCEACKDTLKLSRPVGNFGTDGNSSEKSEERNSTFGQLKIVDPLKYSQEEMKSLRTRMLELKEPYTSKNSLQSGKGLGKNEQTKFQVGYDSTSGHSKIVDSSRYSREDSNAVKSSGLRSLEFKESQSSLSSGTSCEDKAMRNPPNSRSSLQIKAEMLGRIDQLKMQDHLVKRDSASVRTQNTLGCGSSARYSSLRCRPRPKMTYDDLDSTLSADIGDSSYVVTSGKFDPDLFKKPYAFLRSSSERRRKFDDQEGKVCGNKSEGVRSNSTEEKVLKRLSGNLLNAQEGTTKYLNYGLIDPGVKTTDCEKPRHSYLNLESGCDSKASVPTTRRHKERPSSWNEETDEWLRKKRQAYNLANKKIPCENFENKENLEGAAKRDKSEKYGKKKESKSKKFAIFR